MVGYIPGQGDIVWLDFDPQKGKEIKKTRPALVVSLKAYNQKTGLALFMPITSQVKGYPFEVPLGTKKIEGVILSDQMRCLDWKARNATKITSVSRSTVESAISKFKTILGTS
jgi:mRNA interferase MazF